MPSAAGTQRPTQQKRSALTRARILDAALHVFAEQGFEGANTRDIAARAGVTHPMIAYHFGDKEKLWRAAITAMFERLSREVMAPSLAEHDDPVLRYKAMTARYVRYCANCPEHARITIAETVRGGERLRWLVRAFVRENHAVALPLVRELMDLGVLPNGSPIAMLYAIVGMCQLPFVLAKEAKAAFAVNMHAEDMIAAQTEIVFQLLFREPAPKVRSP